MPQSIETIKQRLRDECCFSEEAASAWARAGGRCEYCRRDLIIDRFGYACGGVDHLLPKGKHKHPDVKKAPENWVLACSLCNSTKGKHSVLPKGQDPEQALENRRAELIQMARKYISERRRDKYDPEWERAKRIFFPELDR